MLLWIEQLRISSIRSGCDDVYEEEFQKKKLDRFMS